MPTDNPSVPSRGISSYVPAWLVRQAARDPDALGGPGGTRMHGAFMLADVSGFTRLAEKLRAHGSEGAEILWRQVDGYFGRMMEIIGSHDGEVLRFPGDAAIVFFEQDDAEGGALSRAAACGLALQANLGRYATEDGGTLRMRVALSAGEVFGTWVGGAMNRWEAIVVGSPISQLGDALHAGEIGEVVVAKQAALDLPGWLRHREARDGHRVLEATTVPLGKASASEVVEPDNIELVRAFIPKAVLDRVDEGHARWLAELRSLSVLVATIHGIDTDEEIGPDTVENLQGAFAAMQEAVYRYAGSVNLFLQDDKGIIMVAAWGLPGRAHEDDAVRSVRAALHMRTAVEDVGLAVSIGLAQGRVFCGQRGGRGRLEYGVLGTPVNLAARLAGQTVGGILASPDIQHHAKSRVRFSRGPALALKGMEGAIQAWLPTPVQHEATRTHRPIFGRDRELDRLSQVLDGLEEGVGSTVIIEGEPGVGKSSVLRAMGMDVVEHGLTAYAGAADSIDRQSAYHAFRGVFEEIIGLKRAHTPARRLLHADDWLTKHPDVGELAPLFGPLLGMGFRDTPRTAAMVGQARAETAIEAYIDLLETLDRPVFIIDDIQWLDTASWQLLQQARSTLSTATFILTTRPASAYPSEAYDALRAAEGVHYMHLGPLSDDGIRELVCSRLGAERVSAPLLALILDRCEGLPFYAEEIAIALRDAQQVVVEAGHAGFVGGAEGSTPLLPSTLEGVITSRIDRLSATQQLALKTASVVGRSFLADCVYDVYPVGVDAQRLADELDSLIASDLIEVDSVEPSLSYRFKHIITQEVAYELLLFEQRRDLHRDVATWLEEGHAGTPAAFAARIAWHWQQTGDAVRAIDALETAGEQAFDTFAEREATEFVSSALKLAEEHQVDIERMRLAHWRRIIGEANIRMGHLDRARDHLFDAAALLGFPIPGSTAGVVLALVKDLVRQLFRHRGWSTATPAPDPERYLETANTLMVLGTLAYFLRDIPLVLYGGSRGLSLAQEAGPSPDLARAMSSWSIVMSSMALPNAADQYSQDALDMVQQFDDWHSLGLTQHYRGIFLLSMGRQEEACEILAKAQDSYSMAGNGRRVSEATISVVFATVTSGDYALAERELLRFDDIVEARGDDQAAFWATNLRAELAWRRGEGPEAIEGVDESISKDEVYVVRLRGLRVLLHLGAGQLDEATEALEPLLKLARPTSFIESLGYFALFRHALEQQRAGRGKGSATRKRLKGLETFVGIFPMGSGLLALAEAELAELEGDDAAARTAWQTCLSTLEGVEASWERAAAHRALVRLLDAGDSEEHRRQALELEARMGIDLGRANRASTA